MANKHLTGGRSPGEIAEHELSGTEGGVPRVPDAKMPGARDRTKRRGDEDPRGIAEIDIHTGRTLSEEHTKLPARRPGQPRFDPVRPPGDDSA